MPPKLPFFRPLHPSSSHFSPSFPPLRPHRPFSSYYAPRPSIPTVRPQIIFCTTLGLASLAGAAVWTNLDTQTRMEKLSRLRRWGMGGDVEVDLARSRLNDEISLARKFISWFPKEVQFPRVVAEAWVNMGEAKRTCLGIIGLQAVVFVAWQVPAVRAGMRSWWVHDPLKERRAVTMLTSVFSHRNTMHFLFNSIALYSIGPAAMTWMQSKYSRFEDGAGPRSTSRYEFVAFFIAAGLFSSLTSHLWATRVLLPRMKSVLPSLGASGALYSALSVTALSFPEASVALIFLPWVPIQIGYAFWGGVLLDAIGLFRGWKVFDHAAHLGGALAGVLYFFGGHHAFEKFRALIASSSSTKKPIATR